MTVNEFIQQINEEGIYLNMAEKVALIENGEISVVDVFHIVTSNNEPEAFYASWILNHYVDNHNLAVEDYLNEAVDLLPHIKRSGLLRLVLRLFVITPNWKIEKLGLLLDFCINTLTDMTIPVGVKTHAMSIIDRIAESEPEIREEVLLVVEEIYPYLSTGGKNRAGKIIKKYKRNNHS